MVTFKMDSSKAMAELMLSNCFAEGPVLDRRTNLDFLVPRKCYGFSGTWKLEKSTGKEKLLKLQFNRMFYLGQLKACILQSYNFATG